MKKMIYLKSYNALFNGEEVKEPNIAHFQKETNEERIWLDNARKESFMGLNESYNNWLSSKIPVVGEHSFQDGQWYQEGKDFRIDRCYPMGEKYGQEEFSNILLPHYGTVAIPIQTPKPEDRENNETGSSATSDTGCVI